MLKNVKSIYFLKILFQNLEENKILKILKYNKNLQNIMDINLINYKFFSGKYLIYENGKGKEYDGYSDELIFEGDYLNGERNGKGKEYKFGKLIYESEYLNNKVIYRKAYDQAGNIKYEINYNNGNLKRYNESGELIFEGEYFCKEGNNKEKNYNDFIGSESDDSDNSVEFRNTLGKVNYENKGNLKFEGDFLNGKRNWKGKVFYENNLIFEGEFLYGHKKIGKEYINNRLEYEGEYLFDKKYNGKGYDYNNTIKYELKNGTGKVQEYDYNGNLVFEGEYLNGRKNSKGKEYEDGELIFEGEYLNGKRNGIGKEYETINNILIYEGEYLNGKRNGKGKKYNLKGDLSFDGEYLNGKRWNGNFYKYRSRYIISECKYLNGIKKTIK